METPNFTNARTRKTLKSALGMTLGMLTEHKPRQLATKFIDQYYGQQGTVTSNWLRKTLLVPHDETWSFGTPTSKCKTYTLNPAGVAQVKQILNINTRLQPGTGFSSTQQQALLDKKIAYEWAASAHKLDFKTIEYSDKSNRLFHPVQNLPRAIRSEHLRRSGLPFQYDIVCAAPTLLHQMSWQQSSGHILEYIEVYIQHRTSIRATLAQDTGLPVENIKQLLNAMFAGARFGASDWCSAFDYVGRDPAVVEFLKQDPWFTGFRADLKQMWEYLRPLLPVTKIVTSTGKTRLRQMTSRNKWNLYFALERQVLDVIRSALKQNGFQHFLIHDAFASDMSPEHKLSLEQHIQAVTGFGVKLELQILGHTDDPADAGSALSDSADAESSVLFYKNKPTGKHAWQYPVKY